MNKLVEFLKRRAIGYPFNANPEELKTASQVVVGLYNSFCDAVEKEKGGPVLVCSDFIIKDLGVDFAEALNLFCGLKRLTVAHIVCSSSIIWKGNHIENPLQNKFLIYFEPQPSPNLPPATDKGLGVERSTAPEQNNNANPGNGVTKLAGSPGANVTGPTVAGSTCSTHSAARGNHKSPRVCQPPADGQNHPPQAESVIAGSVTTAGAAPCLLQTPAFQSS